jgi:hypothetical protein
MNASPGGPLGLWCAVEASVFQLPREAAFRSQPTRIALAQHPQKLQPPAGPTGHDAPAGPYRMVNLGTCSAKVRFPQPPLAQKNR